MSGQKNCPRYFWIPKYAFINILKKNISKKVVPGIFEIRKYDLLNTSKTVSANNLPQVFSGLQVCFFKYFKKGLIKTLPQVFLRFVSMIF